MYKKRGILLILLILILLLTINTLAQEQSIAEKGFQWLNSKAVDGSWNNNVFDTSMAVIALQEAGLSLNAEQGANWLLTQQDSLGCFPQGDCKVKETAFAAYALDITNKDSSKAVDWLLNTAQTPTPTVGKWWLQIATTTDGSCSLNYQEANVTFTENITIENNRIANCNNNPWFDLRACIPNNPLARNPSLEFNVDCSSLPGSPIISLIYNRGASYYIIQEDHKSSALIDVDSGCWGITKRANCDYETSLYATYALNKIGVLPGSIIWLRDNYQSSVSLHNSVLALTTGKKNYIDILVKSQEADGSWNKNVYQTSFSALALKGSQQSEELAKAIGFLKSQQREDGSWNNDVVDTSLALLSGFTEERVACGDGFCDKGEEVNCPQDCQATAGGDQLEICFNSVDDDGDAYVDCDDPDCVGDISCEEVEICSDGVDNDFDTLIDCDDSDCIRSLACEKIEVCNDGLDNDNDGLADCDDLDCELDESCPLQKEKGSLSWLWVLLTLLVIGVVLFYFYKKDPEAFKRNIKKPFTKEFWNNLFKKKPPIRPQPPYSYPQRPYQPQQPGYPQYQRRTETEDELSKSLKEAKKLLQKK